LNLKHKRPPFYDVIYNGNIGWNTQELYKKRRKSIRGVSKNVTTP